MVAMSAVPVSTRKSAAASSRRPGATLAVMLVLASAVGTMINWGSKFPENLAFALVSGQPSQDLKAIQASRIARAATEEVLMDAPPDDAELLKTGGIEPRPSKRYKPTSQKRGTTGYARREFNEEAVRLRPYMEPLLEMQLSCKEMTFALNRIGHKIRHLLFRPPRGLPIFTEKTVRQILRKMKNDEGIRMHKFLRPDHVPPMAPGARYPEKMVKTGTYFAEVPPLAPWSPGEQKQLEEPEPAADEEVDKEAAAAAAEEAAEDAAE